MPVKINLIAWNPGPGIAFTMPAPEQVAAFQQRLIARGVPAFLAGRGQRHLRRLRPVEANRIGNQPTNFVTVTVSV